MTQPLLALHPKTRAAGGKIGLIDYGQSKRLPDAYRAAFARLVLELAAGDEQKIATSLGSMGIVTEREDPPLQVRQPLLAAGSTVGYCPVCGCMSCMHARQRFCQLARATEAAAPGAGAQGASLAYQSACWTACMRKRALHRVREKHAAAAPLGALRAGQGGTSRKPADGSAAARCAGNFPLGPPLATRQAKLAYGMFDTRGK